MAAVPVTAVLDQYVFIVTSAQQNKENVLKYNLIQTEERNYSISLSNITSETCLRTITEANASWSNISDYLSSYMIKLKTNYAKKGGPKNRPNLVIEEEGDVAVAKEEEEKEEEEKEEEEITEDTGKTKKNHTTKKAITKKTVTKKAVTKKARL